MKALHLDIWSDIACPWCYVGKRRFEAALSRFPHRDHVTITWRSFELDPSAPPIQDGGVSYAERLGRKYGKSTADAQAMIDSMTEVARQDGLDFRFDRIAPGNTFHAHRLLHLAKSQGRGDEAKERLFRAYFTEGRAMGDLATLNALGTELGLADVEATLASDAYAKDVRRDESDAQELGIRGVPFFVLASRYGVSGAQSPEVLLGALEEAWKGLSDDPAAAQDGDVCGPDGCT
ncbi:MAG: DsbA family oxidoreductase [Myxococcales bacterium]|nr:DsbA family oxidoreductase [Myxococcales bacterium]